MADQLYSAEEAAQILGLQVRTVRNYVRDGRLPGVRIGKQYRIARADLEAFTAGGPFPGDLSASMGQPEGSVSPVQPVAEVSSVVQLDQVGAVARERLERTLTAAALAGSRGPGPALRVEPLYDEERQRLKVAVVGPLGEVADLLRLLDAFTREPGWPGAVSGT